MRINDPYRRLEAHDTQGAARTAGRAATPAGPERAAAGTPHDAVKVSVSAQAQELARRSQGEVDHAKVARLQGAIAEGRLRIDASAVAARLVNGG